MIIIDTYNWNRRDFSATLQCEHCKHEQKRSGCYDDANYYDNVIPSIPCDECGESSNTKASDKELPSIKPKYEPHQVI